METTITRQKKVTGSSLWMWPLTFWTSKSSLNFWPHNKCYIHRQQWEFGGVFKMITDLAACQESLFKGCHDFMDSVSYKIRFFLRLHEAKLKVSFCLITFTKTLQIIIHTVLLFYHTNYSKILFLQTVRICWWYCYMTFKAADFRRQLHLNSSGNLPWIYFSCLANVSLNN